MRDSAIHVRMVCYTQSCRSDSFITKVLSLPVLAVLFQMFFSPWHGDTLRPGLVHTVQPRACSDGFYLGQGGLGLYQSPALLQAADYRLVPIHCQTLPHNDHEVNLWEHIMHICTANY